MADSGCEIKWRLWLFPLLTGMVWGEVSRVRGVETHGDTSLQNLFATLKGSRYDKKAENYFYHKISPGLLKRSGLEKDKIIKPVNIREQDHL